MKVTPNGLSLCAGVLGGALVAVPGAFAAEAFPARPVTIIVPYAPGGTGEVLGRLIGSEMQRFLGGKVIVDLKPGAGGNIGSELVARSARPDGYTVLIAAASLATNVSLMKLNFDPRKDLAPVAGLGVVPNLLVVAVDSPAHSVQDLVAMAKAKPGAITFGSSGLGTSSHLAGELFKVMTGADILHVPYKGSGAVYPDLIGGRIHMLFDLMGSSVPQVQGGKVKAIAVGSPRRSRVLPDVPTIAESGLPGYESGSWFGLFVPVKTPKDVIAKLEQSTVSALETDALKERLAQLSVEPIPYRSAEFGRYFLAEVERWEKLVNEGKIARLQ